MRKTTGANRPRLKRPAEVERTPTNCHARDVLARVGDTWSVYVIHMLGDAGTLRFNELRKEVDGISQRMLTVTLRGLERDGLVARTVYPEIPPRVEYALTPLGCTLIEPLVALADWGAKNQVAVEKARAKFDAARAPGKVQAQPVARAVSPPQAP